MRNKSWDRKLTIKILIKELHFSQNFETDIDQVPHWSFVGLTVNSLVWWENKNNCPLATYIQLLLLLLLDIYKTNLTFLTYISIYSLWKNRFTKF